MKAKEWLKVLWGMDPLCHRHYLVFISDTGKNGLLKLQQMEKCSLYFLGIHTKQLQFPSDLLKWGTKLQATEDVASQLLARFPEAEQDLPFPCSSNLSFLFTVTLPKGGLGFVFVPF